MRGGVWTSKPVVRVYFIGDIQLSLQQLDEQDPAVVSSGNVRCDIKRM